MFKNAIIEECDRLLEKGDIKPLYQIDQEYTLFRKRFSPDVLKSLNGEELIETIFNVMNHDGLTYKKLWIRIKNNNYITMNLATECIDGIRWLFA